MIVDFDDYSENLNHLGLLRKLREINPDFRCTVFAIPALGSVRFWERTPDWIELAVHGWWHPTPGRRRLDVRASFVRVRVLRRTLRPRVQGTRLADLGRDVPGCDGARLVGGRPLGQRLTTTRWSADSPHVTREAGDMNQPRPLARAHPQRVRATASRRRSTELAAEGGVGHALRTIGESVTPWQSPR